MRTSQLADAPPRLAGRGGRRIKSDQDVWAVVAIGREVLDVRAERADVLQDGIAVALPAFLFQRIERKPDQRARVAARGGDRTLARNDEAERDGDETGKDDERDARFHGERRAHIV